jgi:hypothetical protein
MKDERIRGALRPGLSSARDRIVEVEFKRLAGNDPLGFGIKAGAFSGCVGLGNYAGRQHADRA